MKDGNKERPRLEPDPHQAPIVARLFREVLEGKGLKEIIRGLNGEGIAGPRGRGWTKTGLYWILTNEIYTGTFVWGRTRSDGRPPEPIRVEGACEPIVDRETFEKVRSILRERAPAFSHPRRTSSPYLLSGIARCGICGRAMVGQEAKSGKFAYYVCGTLLKKGAGTCNAPYLNAKKFEGLVIDKIKEHILTEENLRELVKLVNEEMDAATKDYKERLRGIAGELADVRRRLDRHYEALETGMLSLSDLAPRIQALRHRQEHLEAAEEELEGRLAGRKAELASLEVVTRYVEDLRELLSQSPLTERKAFIKSFVKEVLVTGKEVVLTYTIPLPPEGILKEHAEVLPIIQSGGLGRIRTCDQPVMSRPLCR